MVAYGKNTHFWCQIQVLLNLLEFLHKWLSALNYLHLKWLHWSHSQAKISRELSTSREVYNFSRSDFKKFYGIISFMHSLKFLFLTMCSSDETNIVLIGSPRNSSRLVSDCVTSSNAIGYTSSWNIMLSWIWWTLEIICSTWTFITGSVDCICCWNSKLFSVICLLFSAIFLIISSKYDCVSASNDAFCRNCWYGQIWCSLRCENYPWRDHLPFGPHHKN